MRGRGRPVSIEVQGAPALVPSSLSVTQMLQACTMCSKVADGGGVLEGGGRLPCKRPTGVGVQFQHPIGFPRTAREGLSTVIPAHRTRRNP